MCVGVEEKVVFVLLKDKVTGVNYCCCECRIVLTKEQGAGDCMIVCKIVSDTYNFVRAELYFFTERFGLICLYSYVCDKKIFVCIFSQN